MSVSAADKGVVTLSGENKDRLNQKADFNLCSTSNSTLVAVTRVWRADSTGSFSDLTYCVN